MQVQAAIEHWKVVYDQQRAAERELVTAIEARDEDRARELEARARKLRTDADEALKQVYRQLEIQRDTARSRS